MSDRVSIIDTIERNGMFSTFARILRSSKVADRITGEGPFTVSHRPTMLLERCPKCR